MTEPDYEDDADIVLKLRAWVPQDARHGRVEIEDVLCNAADEIEALRADLQILSDHREQALNNAMVLMKQRDEITAAAELACGLLWMIEERQGKVREAFHALRDALGGSGSKGLGKAIQRAIDTGHEADHPPGCDWWAGKKETHNA